MAQLLIRNIPDTAKATLRERAARNGRSMESEARQILVDVVTAGTNDPVIEWLDAAAVLREERSTDLEPVPRAPSREVPDL